MMTRKYPVLTKEEREELKQMRKEAGIAIPKIAEYMCTLIHPGLVIWKEEIKE